MISKHEIRLLLSYLITLKDVYCIDMPRIKKTEDEKWRIIGVREAGMKQVDIARG